MSERVKSGELRVKSTKLKIETGESKMNVKFDGMHNEHPTNELRDTGMSRLRRQNRLCSSNVSDTANRLLKRTDSEGSSSVAEKKSSAVPLFRSGHMSAICARLSKGKG